MKTSYWLKDSNKKDYPTLNQNIQTDILIVGGGICGISLAYELRKLNCKITLVEQNQLYHSTTGYTTGKVTFQHGYIYQELIQKKGLDFARLYYHGNQEAIEHLKEIISKEHLDCDYQNCNHSLISKTDDEKFVLEEKAYKILNIDYQKRKIFNDEALTIPNQGVFHVVKYLDGLLAVLNQCENVSIYEHSRILKTKGKIAIGEHFQIQFKQIIFASSYPPYKSFNFYFLKLKPVMSFIAIATIQTPLKEAAINENDPTLSFRPLNQQQMMFAGYSQDSCDLKTYETSDQLVKMVKDKFPIDEVDMNYNQDLQTLDKIPLIGKIKKDFYLATGFNKWGISTSVLASLIIKDLITQQDSVYEKIFSPKRHLPFYKYVLYLFKNIYTIIYAKIHHSKKKCTHLHCHLCKNPISHTYDCPCHGSRFQESGDVITGPAKKDLK